MKNMSFILWKKRNGLFDQPNSSSHILGLTGTNTAILTWLFLSTLRLIIQQTFLRGKKKAMWNKRKRHRRKGQGRLVAVLPLSLSDC